MQLIKQQYSILPIYSLKLVKEKSVKYPVNQVANAVLGAEVARAYLQDKDCEYLAVILLDASSNMIGISTVSIGTISRMQCAVRDIFKAAIVGRANAVIVCHNHPSGDTTPSQEDRIFTQSIVRASAIMSIPLLDHIIVSSGVNNRYYSFLEHNELI